MKFSLGVILMCFAFMSVGQNDQFYVEKFESGEVSIIGQYDDEGKKTGVWLEFWENGNLKYQTSYVNDLADGDYKTFRESGELYGYGNYKEGMLSGMFIGYDIDGNIRAKLKWDMGKLVEQEVLNEEAKPTGTKETIGGKKFVWLFGELKAVKEEQ